MGFGKISGYRQSLVTSRLLKYMNKQFRKYRFRRRWHIARVKRGDQIRDIKIILKLSEIVYATP